MGGVSVKKPWAASSRRCRLPTGGADRGFPGILTSLHTVITDIFTRGCENASSQGIELSTTRTAPRRRKPYTRAAHLHTSGPLHTSSPELPSEPPLRGRTQSVSFLCCRPPSSRGFTYVTTREWLGVRKATLESRLCFFTSSVNLDGSFFS